MTLYDKNGLFVGGVVKTAKQVAQADANAIKRLEVRGRVLKSTNRELSLKVGCTKRHAAKLKDMTKRLELCWLHTADV